MTVEIDGFVPSEVHIRLKAAFWANRDATSHLKADDVTLAAAESVLSDYRLKQWWSLPGFPAWFSNQHAVDGELLAILYEVPRHLRDILESDSPQLSAKVNAVKLLFEVLDRMPAKRTVVKEANKQIASMNDQELEEYIKKTQKRLKLAR